MVSLSFLLRFVAQKVGPKTCIGTSGLTMALVCYPWTEGNVFYMTGRSETITFVSLSVQKTWAIRDRLTWKHRSKLAEERDTRTINPLNHKIRKVWNLEKIMFERNYFHHGDMEILQCKIKTISLFLPEEKSLPKNKNKEEKKSWN